MKKQIRITTLDNTVYEIEKDYLWDDEFYKELNDTRERFIRLGNYLFAKDDIKQVVISEVEEEKPNE